MARGEGGRARATAPLGRTAYRTLALGLLVLGVLIGVLGVHLYRTAWSEAWGEVNDKHRVMAVSLAGAVAGYMRDRRYTVARIAERLGHSWQPQRPLDQGSIALLTTLTHGIDGIRGLALLSADGRLLYVSPPHEAASGGGQGLVAADAYYHVSHGARDYQGGVTASVFDGAPVVLLGRAVRGDDGELSGVLLVELSTAAVEALRAKVQFGKGGHALVVDQHGRVVAHPSAGWMHERRELSGLEVVRLVLTGGSGVAEFYAPFADRRMVAGYAAVPGLGWGAIVPQPKGEIAAGVRAILYGHLARAALVLLALALLAYGAARWLTRPLERLAARLGGRRRG